MQRRRRIHLLSSKRKRKWKYPVKRYKPRRRIHFIKRRGSRNRLMGIINKYSRIYGIYD